MRHHLNEWDLAVLTSAAFVVLASEQREKRGSWRWTIVVLLARGVLRLYVTARTRQIRLPGELVSSR